MENFAVAAGFAALFALLYFVGYYSAGFTGKKPSLLKEDGAFAAKKKSRRKQFACAYAMAGGYAAAVLIGAEYARGGHIVIALFFAALFAMYWAGGIAEPRWFLGQCIAMAIIAAATFLPFL